MSNCKECYHVGICCRTHDFPLTEEELKKDYKSDNNCLQRDVDGNCVYLNAWGRCFIHHRKPQSCKNFECLNLDVEEW